MALSLQKLRIPIIILSSFFFISWSFISNLRHEVDQDFYTIQDFHEDSGKIYFDLACSAQKRGNYKSAIKYYRIVLSHKPDDHDICNNLNFCTEAYNQQLIAHNKNRAETLLERRT